MLNSDIPLPLDPTLSIGKRLDLHRPAVQLDRHQNQGCEQPCASGNFLTQDLLPFSASNEAGYPGTVHSQDQTSSAVSHEPHNRRHASIERSRKWAVTACLRCRPRKTKCDNQRPACGFCMMRNTNIHRTYSNFWPIRDRTNIL
jgi:hypothetical protein